MKKILALVLALLVAMSMTAAFAATTTNDGATEVENDTTLTITKEIVFFNPEEISINRPAVEFTYAIAPATDVSATINDGTNPAVTVKDGISGGVVMATDDKATFAAGAVDASSTGKIASDTFAVEVKLDAFNTAKAGAGVYRYELTETAPSNLEALGYEAATKNYGKRYLDVYLKNGDSGLEVYGYVLFTASNSDTNITKTDETDKTTGFTHEDSDSDYTDDTNVDKYKTYNVTITKKVEGTMGDKSHAFPIYAAGAAGASASTIALGVEDGKVESIALNAGAFEKTNVADLKDSEAVTITGIPMGTTLTINEKNDTPDTYKMEATGLEGFTSSTAANTESGTGTVTSSAIEVKEVTFTNTLDEISPTGVVLRFAPYIAMLAGGVLLLVLARKRRSHKDED